MEEKKERKSWRDIVSSRKPDLDLEDDLAVGEFLDDSFRRYDDSESQRENLNKVLAEDSRAAGILTGLASGMDENGEPFSLVEYLITNYGDDIREAATTEEAIKKAKEKEAARIKEAADEEKRKRDAEEKLRKTDEALTEAVRQVNVDEANVASMLEWLYGTQDAAGMNHWTTIDLGTTILVARKIDPFKTYTVEDLDSMYDLLTSMKSDAIQDELYAAGAALDHNLNSAAMNTYSASKIKKNV